MSKKESKQLVAEFTRLPKDGEREPISALSRSSLDRIVRPQPCNNFNPPVESKVVRLRGAQNSRRGARLISVRSLLAYLESRPSVLVETLAEEIVK